MSLSATFSYEFPSCEPSCEPQGNSAMGPVLDDFDFSCQPLAPQGYAEVDGPSTHRSDAAQYGSLDNFYAPWYSTPSYPPRIDSHHAFDQNDYDNMACKPHATSQLASPGSVLPPYGSDQDYGATCNSYASSDGSSFGEVGHLLPSADNLRPISMNTAENASAGTHFATATGGFGITVPPSFHLPVYPGQLLDFTFFPPSSAPMLRLPSPAFNGTSRPVSPQAPVRRKTVGKLRKQPPTNYCPGADGLFPCVFNGCKHTMDGTIKAVTQHMGNHCTPPIDDDSEKKLACPDVHCRERSKPMPLRSLGRHIASTHFLTTQVACDGCGSTFTRRDSVRKHVCSATPGSTPGADEPPQKKRRL
ncbi:hypothetical protein C8J57DRAFT_1464486 [Mycena rebaudengoi]|nr:hypothetical protein C8J57DRAFT_1464486 [Mycena rebaudengoi]